MSALLYVNIETLLNLLAASLTASTGGGGGGGGLTGNNGGFYILSLWFVIVRCFELYLCSTSVSAEAK